MGRSKQMGSPLSTPKSMTPKVITPLSKEKSSKRPLPAASDEEDEELVTNILNGAPSQKKGKFILPAHTNDDDDDSDSAEDSEEIEDDGDSEVDDSGDTENEGESEDNDSEEDESEEDEDTEEDEDNEDTVQSVPVKVDDTSKQKSQPVQPTLPSPAKTPKTDQEYLLVPGITRNLETLKSTLVEKGFIVDEVRQLNVPLALVSVSTANEAKKLSSLPKPLSVDGNTVHFLHLEGSKDGLSLLSASNRSNTLFVTGIPKSVTTELLQSKVKGEKPTHVKLLSHGPKNKLFNAAILPFENADAADAARDILMKVKFEGRNLHVSYARDLPESRGNRLRGQTKTLLACQLPPSVTEDRLRSLFTTAHRFYLIAKNTETICYIRFTSATDATEAFDAHNNKTLGKSVLDLRFVPDRDDKEPKFLLEVSDGPPNTTVPQLLAVFPGALDAKQNRSGFTVNFPSAEALKSSVSEVKKIGAKELTLIIYGGLNQNEAYIKNLPYAATEKDVKSLFPGATKVVLDVRDGKPLGSASVTFSTANQCSAALNMRCTLQNRPVFIALKRVVINRPANPALTKPPKQNVDQIRAKSKQTPPQVGSASEDSDADDDEGSSEEDEEHSMENEQMEKIKKAKAATEDASDDDETEDDSEGADVDSKEGDSAEENDDEDDDDDDDDEDDDDDGDDDGGDSSEDEGIDEVPHKQMKMNQGDQENRSKGGFQRGNRGFARGGGDRGFKRGFGGGDRGFKRGFGGDRGSTRGFGGGDRGAKRGFGGGDRGSKRGFGGGDRGSKRGFGGGDRGGFKQRGRGGRGRGQKSY